MHPELRFYFKLAEMLGCTVKELLMRIDSLELSYWMAELDIRRKEEEKASKKKHKSNQTLGERKGVTLGANTSRNGN